VTLLRHHRDILAVLFPFIQEGHSFQPPYTSSCIMTSRCFMSMEARKDGDFHPMGPVSTPSRTSTVNEPP